MYQITISNSLYKNLKFYQDSAYALILRLRNHIPGTSCTLYMKNMIFDRFMFKKLSFTICLILWNSKIQTTVKITEK